MLIPVKGQPISIFHISDTKKWFFLGGGGHMRDPVM